jgi:uncharacterized sulfatase
MEPNAMGTVNTSSVFAAFDLVPSLLEISGAGEIKNVDGEILSDVLLGKSKASRKTPIFFRRPPDRKSFYGTDNLPDLAMRNGKWKLLCDFGGARPSLFDLENDKGESKNVADEHPAVVEQMTKSIVQWNAKLPKDAGDPDYRPRSK